MIVLEIKRNGSLLTVAGGANLDTLSSLLDLFGRLGPESKVEMLPIYEPGNATLRVCGSTEENETYNWLQTCTLEVNDFIEIAIIESANASPSEADPTEEELSKMKKLPIQRDILGFEVSFNEDPHIRVGASDLNHISIDLFGLHLLNPSKAEFSAIIVGSNASDSWCWSETKRLRVGDRMKAQIINSDHFDPPPKTVKKCRK